MKERLLKQVCICFLIALALLIADNSRIGVFEKGAEKVLYHMEKDYNSKEALNVLNRGTAAVMSAPDKFQKAVTAVTGKPMYGEPVDDKYSSENRKSVFAVENGEVTAVGENETIGRYIRITHGEEGESLYGNLSKTFVKTPEKVRRGQIIGTYEKIEGKEFYYSFKEFN